MSSVRTRFAPSPTGLLHVGGIRTALFAWLVARQHSGTFILRLEDTDQKREVAGAEQHIIDCLKALGLTYDEGPDIGGSHGPYRQSERLDVYKQWAKKLVQAGRAYADPYTPEEVQAFREQAQKDKQPFLYRNHRPEKPPAWDGSKPLRFKAEPKECTWHDEVMGDLSTGPEVIDDFILMKSDGYPTYNFAHIVDDAEMQVSHIIRGQEFLASVPNYLNLYEALGIATPKMATVPHILNAHGNKKLSKRDGAKDVLDYVREGYLPDALISFIATLGWNDGTEQEVFSREELVKKFQLERVQRSGAHFDEQRLTWVNGCLIREMPVDKLFEKSLQYWPAAATNANEAYKKQVLVLVQERLKFLRELPELTLFFFEKPKDQAISKLYDEPTDKQLKNEEKGRFTTLLIATVEKLGANDFTAEALSCALNELLEETDSKPGVLFPVQRIALTGSSFSPPIAETLAVLGKAESLERLKNAIELLAE